MKPQVILGKIEGNTDTATIQFVNKGIENLNRVVGSAEYEKQFMAFPFVQTDGMNNDELLELFVRKSPVTIDIDIRDMGWWANYVNRTIGAERSQFPGVVFMNSFFVKTAYDVGSNALHEVWHKLGLKHRRASDSKSVPYGNNAIYKSVAGFLGIDPNI